MAHWAKTVLLLQNTQVQFPAPTLEASQLPVTVGDPLASAASCIYMHIPKHRHT